jgi:hypothetical protein
MTDALRCSIHVDSIPTRGAMTLLVAELTGDVMVRGGVDGAWARIAVDDDSGTFELRATDPDDFLGWPTLLEIMPSDSAGREDVVPAVAPMMTLAGDGLMGSSSRAERAHSGTQPGIPNLYLAAVETLLLMTRLQLAP